jgi:hypothetical protein
VRTCTWSWRWLLALLWSAVRPAAPMVVPASAPETAFRFERCAETVRLVRLLQPLLYPGQYDLVHNGQSDFARSSITA